MKFARRHNKILSIAQSLRESFAVQGLPSGSLVSSTRDVAEKYQVSSVTAHRALQQLVDEDIIYRVRGSGSFLKHSFARQKRVGIADGSIAGLYNREMTETQNLIISRSLEYLNDKNYQVQTISYAELSNDKLCRQLLDNLDALLMSYNYADYEILTRLKKYSFPIVIYRHEFIAPLPYSQVIYDFEPGIRQAFQSIAIRSDSEIVIISENTPSSRARKETFLKILRDFSFDTELILTHEFNYQNRLSECFRLARVYAAKFKGKLILTCNDDIAVSLVKGFEQEKLLPGKDFKLISIGNCEQYGFNFFSEPILSSIDMPLHEIAEQSCRLLINLLEKNDEFQHIIKIAGDYVSRKSSEDSTKAKKIRGYSDKRGVLL